MNPKRAQAGFTLTELLVVIVVIAILAALLIPAAKKALEAGNRTRARTEIASIVTAIKQYNNEYGKYPLPSERSGKPEWNGGGSDVGYGYLDVSPSPNQWQLNRGLFYVLRAVNTRDFAPEDRQFTNERHERNLRKIQFLETTDYNLALFPEIASDPEEDCFIDPWGRPYEITIDANYNNSCEEVEGRDAAADGGGSYNYGDITNHTVVVWSRGPDKRAATPDDNIVSWQ